MVQLSHPYMTTGKTIALIKQKKKLLWLYYFVCKVMSVLFNMVSRFVIVFLPRRKCLWISWLQSPSTVTLQSKKIKSVSFHFSPFYLTWSDGTGCHDLSFPPVVRLHNVTQVTLRKVDYQDVHNLMAGNLSKLGVFSGCEQKRKSEIWGLRGILLTMAGLKLQEPQHSGIQLSIASPCWQPAKRHKS